MAPTETRNETLAWAITDAIVAAYEEGATGALRGHLADDVVCRPGGGATLDAEAYLERIEAIRETFPDFRKKGDSRDVPRLPQGGGLVPRRR